MSTWLPAAVASPDARALSSAHAVPGLDAGELHALRRLGGEHTAWPEDAIVLSEQARGWLRGAVRLIVRVISYWDHRTRARTLPGGAISIDAAGCLRIGSTCS